MLKLEDAAADGPLNARPDYVAGGSPFELSTTNPCVVYSTITRRYHKYVHKIKIEYAF